MHDKKIQLFFSVLLLVLGYIYYVVDFGAASTDKTFITITTFVFSIFAGFFITRQSARFTKIREIISTVDGKFSSCYRASSNISPKIQSEVGSILMRHYEKILETKQWDYHVSNKSNTISEMHALLETDIGDAKQESLRAQATGRILTNLADCQVLRKNMIMLAYEKMLPFQWYLMVFYVAILVSTISIIPSVGSVFPSLLKASFVVTILSVMVILRDLDNLRLFESFVGEHSARDVLHIISGTK